jgi:ribosomal protein L11 methyltransferase
MSQNPSFEVHIEINEEIADEVSGELHSLGAEAIEVRDRDGLKLPNVVLPPDGKTWLICGFQAESREQLESYLNAELAETPYEYTILKLELRDDTDWAHKWKEYYKPLKVGDRLWVSPSWETMPEAPGSVVIRLDPEMAFGTGQHQTTRLCLRATDELLPATRPDLTTMKILDVGTGSGILAIGAALLGAKHIVGIDTDDVSVVTAKHNAERNGVGNACFFSMGAMPDAETLVGGPFELILANILADPLVEMAPSLAKLLKKDGTLVLSGLLNEQAERVSGAYAQQGLTRLAHTEEDEWGALTFTKR